MSRLIATAAIAALALAGCVKAGISTASTDNPNFKPDKLFTVDGCNVYRFDDANAWRYLTTCPGKVEWRQDCGKNCTRPAEIATTRREDSR